MFSYYGSKSKIVDYYPPPNHGLIIEPFAGSARYSLKYWDRDVLLVDKYDVIVKLWKWLQSCSEKDILSLPKLKKGDDIRKLPYSDEIKYFIGFSINVGSAAPRNIVTYWGFERWETIKKIVAKNIFKIKHWNIIKNDFQLIENHYATWFIDPPYQFGGEHYVNNSKDFNFNELSAWCKNRNGQVIVCENTKANWMPFKPLVNLHGAYYKTTEAIWSNLPTNYDYQQTSIQF